MDTAAQPAATPPKPAIAPGADDLLRVDDLRVYFHMRGTLARAVDGVSFSMRRGATLGLVGESGCGKSMTALAILNLVPHPGRIESGRILYGDRNLLALDDAAMREIRGDRISMIFQEPTTSLNPLYTVGEQVAEVLRIHRSLPRREAWERAVALLDKVRIPSAAARARDYPHHLSGGMRQRVVIAMALACDPDLVIADEPTTALDVTVQAQILALLNDLRRDSGSAVLMITHDLGVVAETADEVAVMYAGQIVETGSVPDVFARPIHPYTEGLMRSIPRLGEVSEGVALTPIPGSVPSPAHWPEGCRFHPRCPYARSECRQQAPSLDALAPGHSTRCILARDLFG